MSSPSIAFGEVASFLSGFAWSAPKFNSDGTGIPVIRIQNVSTSDSSFLYWNEAFDERFVIREGDMLLTLSGSFRATVWDGPNALLNQRIVKIVPSSRINRRYLLHYLSMKLGDIERMGRHALVNNVSLADLKAMPVPLPPLEEQRRIAAILDQAEELRVKRRATIALLDQLPQAIFLEMFGDPAANPKGLATALLGDLCIRITDGTHQPPMFADSGHPFLFVRNIVTGEINFDTEKFISDETHEELTRRCPIEQGDVIYSTVGSYGVPAVVRTTKKFAFQRHIAHLKPKRDKLLPEFLSGMLASPPVRRQADGFARGVAQKTINLADIRRYLVFAPPIEMQQHFADRVETIHRAKAAHQSALAELDALFVSLQAEAFERRL